MRKQYPVSVAVVGNSGQQGWGHVCSMEIDLRFQSSER